MGMGPIGHPNHWRVTTCYYYLKEIQSVHFDLYTYNSTWPAHPVCCEIAGAGTKESSEPPAVWANLPSSIAVSKHHATTQKGRACRWLPTPIQRARRWNHAFVESCVFLIRIGSHRSSLVCIDLLIFTLFGFQFSRGDVLRSPLTSCGRNRTRSFTIILLRGKCGRDLVMRQHHII